MEKDYKKYITLEEFLNMKYKSYDAKSYDDYIIHVTSIEYVEKYKCEIDIEDFLREKSDRLQIIFNGYLSYLYNISKNENLLKIKKINIGVASKFLTDLVFFISYYVYSNTDSYVDNYLEVISNKIE